MPLKLVTDATAEPVTLAELKEQLRVSTSTGIEDNILQSYIQSARKLAENKTCRAFMPQTWKLVLDDFPGDDAAIILPIAPLSSSATDVVISFLDEASGNTTTLSATAYTVDSDSEPGRVYPSYGNEWPTNVRDVPNAVSIQFVCGYPLSSSSGANTSIEPLKNWIKVRCAMWYEHREPVIEGKVVTDVKRDYVEGLLDPYILPEVH